MTDLTLEGIPHISREYGEKIAILCEVAWDEDMAMEEKVDIMMKLGERY